jgi:hypothetical protein
MNCTISIVIQNRGDGFIYVFHVFVRVFFGERGEGVFAFGEHSGIADPYRHAPYGVA